LVDFSDLDIAFNCNVEDKSIMEVGTREELQAENIDNSVKGSFAVKGYREIG